MKGRSPGAVIFDLDGTLTRPYLDFDAMRAELGLPPGPILEAIMAMEPEPRRWAERVLDKHERRAAENSELQPGAAETVAGLRERRHPLAVLTRNSRHCTDHILKKFGLAFDAIWTREDGAIKPSPVPVFALCKRLEVRPGDSWVVGDYLFDIQSGREAGAATVLMLGDRTRPSYADQADHIIQSLAELLTLLPPAAHEPGGRDAERSE